MIPEHIRIGRNKWYAWLRRTIDERMICEKKLAKRLNMSAQQIRNIISEVSYPKRKNLTKINELLGGEIPYFHYQKKHVWMVKEQRNS